MSIERPNLSLNPSNPSKAEKSETGISSIALAFGKRKTKESVRMRERLFELTQNPGFAPQEEMALEMDTNIHASLIDHALANRTMVDSEIISTFNFTDFVANFLLKHKDSEDDYPEDEEEIIEVAKAIGEGLRGSSIAVVEEAVQSGFLPQIVNSTVNEIDNATDLAREKGVSVEEVFESDDLYLDLQRKSSSLEQNIAVRVKSIEIINGRFIERIAKSGVSGFIQNVGGIEKKDRDEILADLENDSSDKTEMFNSMVTPMIIIAKEGLERLWGTEASSEFLKRIEGISKIESSS